MEITTSRLRLREYVKADWPDVLAYQCEPLYLLYYEWSERTPEAVRDFVQMFINWQAELPRYRFQFVVELSSTGKLIGSCGIRRKFPDAIEADIGYELAPAQWGNGYATEAAAAVVDFGFNEMNLHRISSWCIADNIASARVLEKLGLRAEGRLRQNEYFKGRYWDTLLFAMLRKEWEERTPP